MEIGRAYKSANCLKQAAKDEEVVKDSQADEKPVEIGTELVTLKHINGYGKSNDQFNLRANELSTILLLTQGVTKDAQNANNYFRNVLQPPGGLRVNGLVSCIREASPITTTHDSLMPLQSSLTEFNPHLVPWETAVVL